MADRSRKGSEILRFAQNDIAGLFCLPMDIHEYQAKELLQKFNVATALPRASLR
jgi:hypothetical protein